MTQDATKTTRATAGRCMVCHKNRPALRRMRASDMQGLRHPHHKRPGPLLVRGLRGADGGR